MKLGSKVGIVCCSNGLPHSYTDKINKLIEVLNQIGLAPVLGEYIYEDDSIYNRNGIKRANALMNFYRDDEIEAIFDIFGGDISNEILPYLNFDIIANSGKQFWGYSDLTTIINAIYTKTNTTSVLYQVRNLISDNKEKQIARFTKTLFDNTPDFLDDTIDLFNFKYNFIQGESLKGIVVGGNIRCLLKLAGTEYWPDMTDKILLLEAYGGMVPQMTTYLSQLKQLGVFEKVSGIILGTFTQMEEERGNTSIIELVQQFTDENMTIVKTDEIGHGTNSKGIIIGKEIHLL